MGRYERFCTLVVAFTVIPSALSTIGNGRFNRTRISCCTDDNACNRPSGTSNRSSVSTASDDCLWFFPKGYRTTALSALPRTGEREREELRESHGSVADKRYRCRHGPNRHGHLGMAQVQAIVPFGANAITEFVPAVSSPARGSPHWSSVNSIRLWTKRAHHQSGAVLDQRISEEITFLPNSELQKMRARYVDAFDEAPQANVACSNDQLAALNHVLLTGREPYADLAVWAPHGTRILKKSSLSGLNLMRDGTFQQVELFGPPNVEQWCANYDVLSTGCIMLGAVRRPNLAAYKRWICKLSACYGPSVWHLLYQTDVRCRQELMQAVFQELLAAHSAAVMAKTHTDFDPTRPWDAVWKRVLEMKDWWTDEFERPAGLIVTHVKGLNYGLGGDVQIAGQRTTPFQPPQSNNSNNGDNGGKGVRKNNNKNKNKGPRNQGHQNGAAPTNIAKGGKGGKGNGAPASAAAASTLWCKICKSTEHDHLQCPQFVQNYSGGKNRKGKGTKGSK